LITDNAEDGEWIYPSVILPPASEQLHFNDEVIGDCFLCSVLWWQLAGSEMRMTVRWSYYTLFPQIWFCNRWNWKWQYIHRMCWT